MYPARAKGSNTVFGADQRGVSPIWGRRFQEDGAPIVEIAFRPSEGELQHLLEGGAVLVQVVGQTMPPMRVTTGEEEGTL